MQNTNLNTFNVCFFYVRFKIMRPLVNTLIFLYIILKNYIHNLLGKMKKKYLRFQEANLWPKPCGFHVGASAKKKGGETKY